MRDGNPATPLDTEEVMAVWMERGRVGSEHADKNYADIAVGSFEELNGGDGVYIRDQKTYTDDVPTYVEVMYTGRVVAEREMNGYHDSDFYARVETQPGVFTEVMWGTTRFYAYGNGCYVDATPEVKERWEAVQRERAEKAAHAARVRHHERLIADAKLPSKGDLIEVVRGRKVPRGTVGVVFWVGTCQFSGKPRIGFNDSNGTTHWTAGSNCEVNDWESKLTDEDIEFAKENDLL